MRNKRFFIAALAAFLPFFCMAQGSIPSLNPTANYLDADGMEAESSDNISGQAPLSVTFHANPSNMEGYSPTYEWHFHKDGDDRDLAVRYEEDTQYTFIEAGVTLVTLIVKYNSTELEDYTTTFSVTISASKLIFPNAFSPNNGDDVNNVFKAKAYESIVEFHAYIFNRYGQKLYEWTNINDGWDGTYHGHPVKDGVYYVLVKARGADGVEYNIRRDVNLLRKHNNTLGEGGTTTDE